MSNNKQDSIKKVFSSKLKNFEAEPPADSWNNIASALANADIADIKSHKQVNKTFYTKLIAVAAMLLLLSLGIYQIYNNHDENNLNGLRISENTMLKMPSSFNDDFNQNLLASSDTKQSIVNDIQEKVSKSNRRQFQKVKSSNLISEKIVDNSVNNENADNNTTEEIAVISELPKDKEEKKQKDVPTALLPKKKQSKANGILINSNAMLLAEKNESKGGINTIMSSKEQESVESPEKVLLDFMQRENKDYVLEHSIPISFELLFSKDIYPNLYLESGLSLTHLSTTITSNSILNFREKVKFLYLGVPLNVRYNILSVGKGSLFLQAGMVFQKDIYGEYKRQIEFRELSDMHEYYYLAAMNMKDYSTERVHQKHWQLSSRLNVGFSYPLYRSLQLQAAVGGAYYFNANNLYPTIYSDKKLQLDFNIGLKFNFK